MGGRRFSGAQFGTLWGHSSGDFATLTAIHGNDRQVVLFLALVDFACHAWPTRVSAGLAEREILSPRCLPISPLGLGAGAKQYTTPTPQMKTPRTKRGVLLFWLPDLGSNQGPTD